MSDFVPRPNQRQVLDYAAGKLGIAAVPGSGKTRTLAALAARLVIEKVRDDQEVLVVTLVNSAVDNFRSRINETLSEHDLIANLGYRVRTLHGLAHDIVRERPALVGLSDDFGIIDEREADAMREAAAEAWLRAHPDSADPYFSPDLEGDRAEWVKGNRWPRLVRDVASAFVKRAKDLELAPELLQERMRTTQDQPSFQLARMGAEIYADYQRSLSYRGGVDFDDLIRLALAALRLDREYLLRLRRRWPFILEDEAQDSSRLQERILRMLAGSDGNWVRVGDPNQAIYETFTTADPELLRSYIGKEDNVSVVELPESGRSQPAIIGLANHLIEWVQGEHPVIEVRSALAPPLIQPTGQGDPQQNPPMNRAEVRLVLRDLTPDQELVHVADSLEEWLPENRERTVAVLSPRNKRGFELVDLLKKRGLPYVELLRSTRTTRETAGALGNLLHCLADPTSPRKLATAFRVWRRDLREDPNAKPLLDAVAKRIRGCRAVEAYLWPRADHDWVDSLLRELSEPEEDLLVGFREEVRRWHRAATLGVPIDQLVLTLAGDLFRDPRELALAHKLALLLGDVAEAHPGYRLSELVTELAVIARNERRFLGFTREDAGFEPPKGVVTVATMHKAKGLEWDRVYLMSVNNYDFPSVLPHDSYLSEPWYVRDDLNLEAEALAQLGALAPATAEDRASRGTSGAEPPMQPGSFPTEGAATYQARLDYAAERVRLLYVGITRARRDLIVTWNTGRRRDARLEPAVPFAALHDWWMEQTEEMVSTDD
jgi:DNA helicase-2/ATP-dependent DNA helicase PcrA